LRLNKAENEEASRWITGQVADHIEGKRSHRQIKSKIEAELYQSALERMAEVGLSVGNPDFSRLHSHSEEEFQTLLSNSGQSVARNIAGFPSELFSSSYVEKSGYAFYGQGDSRTGGAEILVSHSSTGRSFVEQKNGVISVQVDAISGSGGLHWSGGFLGEFFTATKASNNIRPRCLISRRAAKSTAFGGLFIPTIIEFNLEVTTSNLTKQRASGSECTVFQHSHPGGPISNALATPPLIFGEGNGAVDKGDELLIWALLEAHISVVQGNADFRYDCVVDWIGIY
jgi:hypothetical protein